MAFGFILLQHGFCLSVKHRMGFVKSFGEVLVYGGFAYAEFFGGGAYRCTGFNYVLGKAYRPFFQIVFHIDHSKPFCYGKYMRRGERVCDKKGKEKIKVGKACFSDL